MRYFIKKALAMSALIILLVGYVGAAYAGIVFKFTNNTTEDANDLHVEFVQHAEPEKIDGKYGPFIGGTNAGGGSNTVDFNAGTVKVGDSALISFTTTSSKLTVTKWWWTKDTVQIGETNKETDTLMVTFDQLRLVPGETMSVELYGVAASQNATYQVDYNITTPGGDTYPFPPFEVNLVQGTDHHRQLLVTPADELGVYQLNYTAINLETGEVFEGSAPSLTVDDGVRPLPIEEPVQ